MVKTSLFSLIVQFIKSQFHSWLLSKIKFIDLITLLIYTLRYLYHCIVTNTVLLDQSLKSSLKITLSERITNDFFSPCGKRSRYQRHVISIKWRKNDEKKHLNISTTFFTFLKNGCASTPPYLLDPIPRAILFSPETILMASPPRSPLISVTQLTLWSSLHI